MVFRDSIIVMNKTSKPKSLPQKKNNAMSYPTVRKSVAIRESLTFHNDGNKNSGKLINKSLMWWKYSGEFKPYVGAK